MNVTLDPADPNGSIAKCGSVKDGDRLVWIGDKCVLHETYDTVIPLLIKEKKKSFGVFGFATLIARDQLIAFYKIHDPSKLPNVDDFLEKYPHAVIKKRLLDKYGASPLPTAEDA